MQRLKNLRYLRRFFRINSHYPFKEHFVSNAIIALNRTTLKQHQFYRFDSVLHA
jgi:hypothetical protein